MAQTLVLHVNNKTKQVREGAEAYGQREKDVKFQHGKYMIVRIGPGTYYAGPVGHQYAPVAYALLKTLKEKSRGGETRHEVVVLQEVFPGRRSAAALKDLRAFIYAASLKELRSNRQ